MSSTPEQALFLSVAPQLGVSQQRARRMIAQNKFPVLVALEAERITAGKLGAVKLCPELDTPQPAHIRLADAAVSFSRDELSASESLFLMEVLRFFEQTQPTFYHSLRSRLVRGVSTS